MRTFLLILTLLSGGLSLLAYEQGTYFFCLTFKGSQAPAGRIPLAAALFKDKALEDGNKQKITAKNGSIADERSNPTQSIDLGALAGERKNNKVEFFDTSKLFQKDPSKSKTQSNKD